MNDIFTHEEIGFADCLTCNEITEQPAFLIPPICAACGDDHIITPA